MSRYTDLVEALEKHLRLLESKFLSQFLPASPESKPDDWGQHTKAFCVLAHAAFEEFIEKTSLAAAIDARQRWLDDRVILRSLLTLLSFYNIQINYEKDHSKEQSRVFDLLRNAVEAAVKRHSHELNNNHGFDVPYLRKVLTPVGIDSDAELKLTASLEALCAARGKFAHAASEDASFEHHNRRHIIAPEDAIGTARDCFEYCKLIAGRADSLSSTVVKISAPPPPAVLPPPPTSLPERRGEV